MLNQLLVIPTNQFLQQDQNRIGSIASDNDHLSLISKNRDIRSYKGTNLTIKPRYFAKRTRPVRVAKKD